MIEANFCLDAMHVLNIDECSDLCFVASVQLFFIIMIIVYTALGNPKSIWGEFRRRTAKYLDFGQMEVPICSNGRYEQVAPPGVQ